MQQPKTTYILALALLSILIAEAAGWIGSLYTIDSISSWYVSLNKPWFTPPNWLFGPVWTILYAMMGAAAFLVWYRAHPKKSSYDILAFYGVHLIVNTLWSIIFFGQQNLSLGLGIIIILWFMIAVMIVEFRKFSHLASWLLIPYILWVSFATALNYQILVLN